jgi:quercetin dioxygenase-like cupin family protein
MPSSNLAQHPIHLGLGATAEILPEFTGMEWYETYSKLHAADGAEGRLVSISEFTEDWTSWEMHPAGEEVVICIDGVITLHQELPEGQTNILVLHKGEYAINPRGVWHTADVDGHATALFITSGMDTQHKPR